MSARLGIQVEDAARAQLAFGGFSERDQVALREDCHRSLDDWSIAPAQQHGLPARKTRGVGTAYADRREALHAGGNRLQQTCERRGIGGLKPLEAHAILLAERADTGAPQRRDMTEAAEDAAHVAGERSHIGPLAAFGAEQGVVGIGNVDQAQAVDLDRAGLELDDLTIAGLMAEKRGGT
jgi:hypothetical protein